MAKKKMIQFFSERSQVLENKILSFGYTTEKKKMFGHETFFTTGYMFTGAAPFEPMEGLVMKDYLLLKDTVCDNEDSLKLWLGTAYAYLNTLPPKVKKNKKIVSEGITTSG